MEISLMLNTSHFETGHKEQYQVDLNISEYTGSHLMIYIQLYPG